MGASGRLRKPAISRRLHDLPLTNSETVPGSGIASCGGMPLRYGMLKRVKPLDQRRDGFRRAATARREQRDPRISGCAEDRRRLRAERFPPGLAQNIDELIGIGKRLGIARHGRDNRPIRPGLAQICREPRSGFGFDAAVVVRLARRPDLLLQILDAGVQRADSVGYRVECCGRVPARRLRQQFPELIEPRAEFREPSGFAVERGMAGQPLATQSLSRRRRRRSICREPRSGGPNPAAALLPRAARERPSPEPRQPAPTTTPRFRSCWRDHAGRLLRVRDVALEFVEPDRGMRIGRRAPIAARRQASRPTKFSARSAKPSA